MIGWADILLRSEEQKMENLPPLTDEKHRQIVKIIHMNGKRLAAMIDDIRDYARIDAKNFRIEPEPTHLQPLVAEIVRHLTSSFKDKSQTLTVEVSDNIPLVYVDENRIILYCQTHY